MSTSKNDFFLLFFVCLMIQYQASKMKKSERLKRKINNYLFDHQFLRIFLSHASALIHASLAAAIFAFGFCAFISPADDSALHIATGGVSGVSQTIAVILKLVHAPEWIIGNNAISIAYFVINIPIVIFAFFKIGKRFAIYTAINVGLSSLFIFLFTHAGFTNEIATHPLIADHVVVRVLFGALCVGVSSATAYRGDISCGGIDVFTYYFALRKSTSIGKYGIALNGVIVTAYSIILVATSGSDWEIGVIAFFFSIFYLLEVNFVIDAINLRNKKIQLQIITTSEYLAPVLIANFPHGATVTKGEGAYSHAERKIIYIVVSSSEVKSVVSLARKVDHNAFISVTSLVQVYGNFFIKPVE